MRLAALGLALAFAAAGSAHAAVTFSSTAYDPGVPQGQTLIDDFDQPIMRGYTFTGGQTAVGAVYAHAAAPAQDRTQYEYVGPHQIGQLTSTRDLTSFSAYLGSIDAVNDIRFLFNGKTVANFLGSDLVANANGNQKSGLTNRLFNFSFGGAQVDEVQFTSRSSSFEFDNLAASAVPEPGTWALLIFGLGGMGLVLRRMKVAPKSSLAPDVAA